MRSRILGVVAALLIGGVGGNLVAGPAQATGDHVTFDSSCVGVTVKVDPGRLAAKWRIQVDGATKWESDGNLGESATVDVPKGTVVVQIKGKDGWVNADDYIWVDPGNCKPVDVTVEQPTCKCLDLVVTVTNPNAKGWVLVKFDGGAAVKVYAGKSTVFKARADVKVYVGGKAEKFELVKTVEYKTPECTTPSPSTSPSTSPSPSPSASPSAGPAGTPTQGVTPAGMTPPGPSVLPTIKPIGNEDRLPTTGANTGWMVVGGIGALLLGGAALAFFRRKQHRFTA